MATLSHTRGAIDVPLLEETIDELSGQAHEEWIDPEIKLPVVGRLPDDYVADVSQRLVLYKRLSSARDENEVALIRDELLDRFGRLPSEAENLLEVIRLKIAARRLGIVRIETLRGEIVLQFAPKSQIDPDRLVIPGIRLPAMTERMGRLIHPELFGKPEEADFQTPTETTIEDSP